MTVFPILRIRGRGGRQADGAISNPYAWALVANWADAEAVPVPAVGGLSQFMDFLAARHQAPTDEPRALIIDQFEEIFTYRPELWESRDGFFRELSEALLHDRNLRIILSMREDYVAQVDPYAPSVPNHLQHRFRIERLRKEQALQAVTGPLRATARKFAPGAAEYLVDQLLQIRLVRDGQLIQSPGEYVEPVQLRSCAPRFGTAWMPSLSR